MRWCFGFAVLLIPTVGLASSCSSPSAAERSTLSFGYQLYTHCGIYEAKIGNAYYVAVRPLDDGNGNPPSGWANPYQRGTVTLASATSAVFTDSLGHRVEFRLRPGATSFLRVCS
jgi:hypothetical protein